jgi:hypothetical protein
MDCALLIVPHAQRLLDATDAEALVTHQIALYHCTHTNPPKPGQAPLEANASKAGKTGTKQSIFSQSLLYCRK